MKESHKLKGVKQLTFSLLSSLVLAACGGGDDNDEGTTFLNQAPNARAGNDITVEEFSTVVLDGSASTDPNVSDVLSYSWVQTSGNPQITIVNSNLEQASFTAPDVALGSPQQYTFRLTVSDESGSEDSDSVTITVQEPGPDVNISGVLEYEFVPANVNCQGLAFNSIQEKPIRGATVELVNANNNQIVASTVTDNAGNYSFTVGSLLDVFIRVRAELKRSGTPSWDVEVRDNTTFDEDGIGNRTPLAQRPLYVLDSAVFSSGLTDSTRDILAETGWDGSAYSGTRAAAPFSILDVIYDGMLLVLSVDSDAQFPALDAFWSVNNSSTQGTGSTNDNIDSGELGGSFYRSGIDSLFLLGMEDDDTEEFDDHVIAHEWGHYFEDNFSRSDSIGGSHTLGQRLDMRVAFGEGWGTALSGMSTGSPIYCDTGDQDPPVGQFSGFGFNIETQGFGPDGWFNEITVTSLLYDLWDSDESGEISGSDNDSLGFLPIFDVMTNEQRTTTSFTSIFSFMTELKNNNPGDTAFINGLLSDNIITTNLDIYGSNETNDSESVTTPQDVLPVYTMLVPNGSVVNVCSNSQYDVNRDGNKLSERQFLRFQIPSAGNYRFSVANSSPPETPPGGFDCEAAGDAGDPDAHRYSDPDFFVYQGDTIVAGGAECTPNFEPSVTFPLSTGEHVMSLVEFRYADEETVNGYPERSCFNVSVTPVP